jgi:hypothetical protein
LVTVIGFKGYDGADAAGQAPAAAHTVTDLPPPAGGGGEADARQRGAPATALKPRIEVEDGGCNGSGGGGEAASAVCMEERVAAVSERDGDAFVESVPLLKRNHSVYEGFGPSPSPSALPDVLGNDRGFFTQDSRLGKQSSSNVRRLGHGLKVSSNHSRNSPSGFKFDSCSA